MGPGSRDATVPPHRAPSVANAARDRPRRATRSSIIAQAPTVGTRELARALHVNASTISRWRKSLEFKKLVERKAEIFKSRAATSEKVDQFIEEGPLQKDTLALLLATVKKLYGPKKKSR